MASEPLTVVDNRSGKTYEIYRRQPSLGRELNDPCSRAQGVPGCYN